jgi:hypothetical protein
MVGDLNRISQPLEGDCDVLEVIAGAKLRRVAMQAKLADSSQHHGHRA